MKRLKNLFLMMAIAFTFASCTTAVTPGYIGMVQTPDGLSGEILQPGNHSCWGRDKMIVVENAETNFNSEMSVLCADELNFKFDVNVLARLRNDKGEKSGKMFANILERQGGKLNWESNSYGVLKFQILYTTYLAPQIDAIARSVVGKYKTTDIRANRDKIEADITAQVKKIAGSTPIDIVTVVTSNFDYPEVITLAQEKAKEREIALKEEDSKQALLMKQMKNRKKLAEEAIVVRAKEAQAEAVYIRILGSSLTKNYLQLRAIENQEKLYSKSTNTLVVPEGSTPFIGAGK